jgi:hypothetical protein
MRFSLLRTSLVITALATSGIWAAEKMATGKVVDRVGLPPDYAKTFEVVRRFNAVQRNKAATVYANSTAGALKEIGKLPYAHGSIFIVAWAEPVVDGAGKPVVDGNGLWQPGEVTQIDVMRREKDFGVAYGADRTGEWEFASYKEGKQYLSPNDAVACAKCHQKAESRDFVFRGRFPAISN